MADVEPQDAYMYFTVGSGTGPAVEGTVRMRALKGKNAFELTEFTVKAENSTNIGSSTGGAGGAGKVRLDRLAVRKRTGRETVGLLEALTLGGHYDEAVVEVHADDAVILRYSFLMCVVSECATSFSDGEMQDELVVDYGALKVEHFRQKRDGTVVATEDAVWSRVLNTNEYAAS